MHLMRWHLIALALIGCSLNSTSRAGEYDPLQVDLTTVEKPLDVTIRDEDRDRDIPVRVYLPANSDASSSALPVVLFSHGLGGSRENNPYLGQHWSARGYAVVFVQHVGSDESVWRGVAPRRIVAKLRQAASAEQFAARVKDVPVVLDRLAKFNRGETQDPPAQQLRGRLDLNNVGMSGHSFGAITTQALAGQSFGRKGATFTEPRIQAAVLMSPSSPRWGSAEAAFGRVSIPWLLLTGTHDDSPIGGQTPESRLEVFPALPAGDKYQVVLDGAEHSAFSQRALPGDRRKRNPNHHRAILALTTAFWDTYLRNEAEARAWLNSNGPKTVLEESDKWESK